MRYCQNCGAAGAEVLGHDGDEAVCPTCGHREPAPRRALYVVTGASAVGKSTVTAALAAELAREVAVFDSDTLMDAFARAGDADGIDDIDWDALAEAWVEVAHGIARQGRDTVLLCSFEPALIERLPNRAALAAVHYLLLDCDDAEREARLAARPAWRGPDADVQRVWSRQLRSAVETCVRTDLRSPDETVDAIATWVRTGGHHAGDPPVDPPRPARRPRARATGDVASAAPTRPARTAAPTTRASGKEAAGPKATRRPAAAAKKAASTDGAATTTTRTTATKATKATRSVARKAGKAGKAATKEVAATDAATRATKATTAVARKAARRVAKTVPRP